MRIIDQRSVQSLSSVRNARGGAAAGGARFTLDQGSPTAKAEGAAPAAILGGLEALIAIQSEDTTKERRRRIVRRGQGLLDLLDELKIALLAGVFPLIFRPGFPSRCGTKASAVIRASIRFSKGSTCAQRLNWRSCGKPRAADPACVASRQNSPEGELILTQIAQNCGILSQFYSATAPNRTFL